MNSLTDSLRQKAAWLFGIAHTPDEWARSLNYRARTYGLEDVEEVNQLRHEVLDVINRGDVDRLRYMISQIDPYLRVRIYNDAWYVLHYESDHDVPVLRPSTVFQYHRPYLGEDLTKIVVDGAAMRLYVHKEKVAEYHSLSTIPVASASQSVVPALGLIEDFTGLRPTPDLCMRMNRAVVEKRGRSWFIDTLA